MKEKIKKWVKIMMITTVSLFTLYHLPTIILVSIFTSVEVVGNIRYVLFSRLAKYERIVGKELLYDSVSLKHVFLDRSEDDMRLFINIQEMNDDGEWLYTKAQHRLTYPYLDSSHYDAETRWFRDYEKGEKAALIASYEGELPEYEYFKMRFGKRRAYYEISEEEYEAVTLLQEPYCLAGRCKEK